MNTIYFLKNYSSLSKRFDEGPFRFERVYLDLYSRDEDDDTEDENIEFKDILHLEIKQTLSPIQYLIEEEQRLLPSDTDVTISAHEIFNNRDLSQDVTTVIFDILKAAKLEA